PGGGGEPPLPLPADVPDASPPLRFALARAADRRAVAYPRRRGRPDRAAPALAHPVRCLARPEDLARDSARRPRQHLRRAPVLERDRRFPESSALGFELGPPAILRAPIGLGIPAWRRSL